jgi:hypothetical protein
MPTTLVMSKCRPNAVNALIWRDFYLNADLATKRLDFVQRLVQVYRPKTFGGAPVAVAPDSVWAAKDLATPSTRGRSMLRLPYHAAPNICDEFGAQASFVHQPLKNGHEMILRIATPPGAR